jgi:hypothetical protein
LPVSRVESGQIPIDARLDFFHAPLQLRAFKIPVSIPIRQITAEELADIISKRHYLRRKAEELRARLSQVVRE